MWSTNFESGKCWVKKIRFKNILGLEKCWVKKDLSLEKKILVQESGQICLGQMLPAQMSTTPRVFLFMGI